MTLLHIITAPLVGAVIGYITNYIAIKMLFRPLKPIMIGRFRVPFTPGIVPKRKDALARALGRSIVDIFFNTDDIEIIFMSDYFKNAVADSVVNTLYSEETRVGGLSQSAPSDAGHRQLLTNLKDEICVRIQAAILKADLKSLIAEEGGRILGRRFGSSPLGKVLNDDTAATFAVPLTEHIEKYILKDSRAVIMQLLDEEFNELADEPVKNIALAVDPDRVVMHAMIVDLYTRFMRTRVHAIVSTIDVGGMITEKVLNMQALDIEKLVLLVVKRELNYVVLLGALLGTLIGAVNIFI